MVCLVSMRNLVKVKVIIRQDWVLSPCVTSSRLIVTWTQFLTLSDLIEPVSCQAAQLGIHFIAFTRHSYRCTSLRDRRRKKSRTGGIWTHNLLIMRCALYRCATLCSILQHSDCRGYIWSFWPLPTETAKLLFKLSWQTFSLRRWLKWEERFSAKYFVGNSKTSMQEVYLLNKASTTAIVIMAGNSVDTQV